MRQLVGTRQFGQLALACVTFALVVQHAEDSVAQTDRDLIPVALEYCLIATEDPERASSFALGQGFVARDAAAETTSYVLPGESFPRFLSARMHRREGGEFALECEFRIDAIGDVSTEEVMRLASQFGLDYRRANENTHILLRRTSHTVVIVYAVSTEGVPCPRDGRLEIAPEVLEEHPDALDRIRQICDRRGFLVALQSSYSPNEIED
jgi:hypothetical protein